MNNLIIPVAGSSTRFPGVRPKWLLTHPNGNLMFAEAIKGLNLDAFDRIYLACLGEHLDQYGCRDSVLDQFRCAGIGGKASIVVLDKRTGSQPETIAAAIRQESMEGSVCVKDCDNFFDVDLCPGENFITTADLGDCLVNAANKSYVALNEDGLVVNIVEKDIVSRNFCTGCYGFKDAGEYLQYYDSLVGKDNLYVSHVIFKMILDNHRFKSVRCENYSDWGTLSDWNKYKKRFSTVFVDLDGTLVENSSEHLVPKWGETAAIRENADAINKLYDSGTVRVIITTSRKESSREATLAQLEREGIRCHDVIFGLFHGMRVVINDYSDSNPFRSCDSINIARNDNGLGGMLHGVLGEP